MPRRINEANISVGCPPSSPGGSHWLSGEDWTSFQFHFHDFANLSITRDDFVASPKFTCNGQQWELWVYPGGHILAAEGQVSFFLRHLSKETVTTSYDVKIVDKFGDTKLSITSKKRKFIGIDNWGIPNFLSRSVIMDESQNTLDSGTLTVVVSIEVEPTPVFFPKNPLSKLMQEKFNDEATADVCFEVSTKGEKEDDGGMTTPFYAHRFILETCAPMLAAICGPNNDSGGVVTASVNDIKPEIFSHLLSYVNGMTVPEEELKANAKDIIAASDKYSIVNLKLAAEAAYVQSADICFDNVMDHLLYADSMNLALLKEAVMNFLAENPFEAAERLSFTDSFQHVVKDLLITVGRNNNKYANGAYVKFDELTTLSVSALRRQLDKMGLEVDGSREVMIESIKSHLEEAILE